MSRRSIWKVLHLLHTARPASIEELRDAGIHCEPDTIDPLLDDLQFLKLDGNRFALSERGRKLLDNFLVAHRRFTGEDMRVDHPSAFVAIPYGGRWDDLCTDVIKPVVEAVGLTYVRADNQPRVGSLMEGVWGEILQAGIIIAELSEPNPNVFYELGLVHALGKDVIVLKENTVHLAADFRGTLYVEYVVGENKKLSDDLRDQLEKWMTREKVGGVAKLYGN
jgi:hypothetical protein